MQDTSDQAASEAKGNSSKGSECGQDILVPSEVPSHSPSPNAFRCPSCSASCKSPTHLQRHIARHHQEESNQPLQARSASEQSAASSLSGAGGGVESSPNSSSPCPRSSSSLTSSAPLNFYSNPFLSISSGKLKCPFCSCEGMTSFEAMQLHVQSVHGPTFNGDNLGGAGLAGSLNSLRELSGLYPPLLSPLTGAGCSRQVTCELCGARVNGVGALQRHVVTAHTFTELLARAAVGVFCTQCLVPFSNPGALAEHIKLVHTPAVLSGLQAKRQISPTGGETPTDLSKKARRDVSDLPSSTLLCNQCDAPFSDFESFRAHLKTHLEGMESTGGSSFSSCPECHIPIGSEKLLEEHLASHLESSSTEYGCHACAKYFNKPDELQKHLMDIHAHHLFRCALCKEMFDSKVSIQVHFAVKHSNESKVYRCLRCHLKFRLKSEFEAHLRIVHLGRDSQKSNGTQQETQLYQQNLSRSHGGGYRCLLCPSILATEIEMTSHLATHQRQFQCSLCDEAFHVEFLLDRHVQTKHCAELNGGVCQPENLSKPTLSPRKDLRCGICDIDFPSESALGCHRKQVHSIKSGVNSSSTPTAKVAAATLSLFCAYCNEVCKSRTDLEAHIKTHQGTGGRHKCNICDELFPSAATLAQHKLAHIKVISGNTCIICRETLHTAEQISHHQADHHSLTFPQPCIICRQTLVADIEVRVHSKFHGSQMQGHSVKSEANFGVPVGDSPSGEQSAHRKPSPVRNECTVKKEYLEDPDERDVPAKNESTNSTTPSRTFQCIKCQESFASEEEIESHVASHLLLEGSSHECHLCKAVFDTPLRLQCHLIEHTFEGCSSYTCYLCSSVFTTAARLQHHMVGHGLSAKPYDCHHCHLRFFFRAELENHLPTHPEASAEEGCKDCSVSFPEIRQRMNKSIADNSAHLEALPRSEGDGLVHHTVQPSEPSSTPTASIPVSGESPDKIQFCKTCSRKFSDALRLRLHSLTHEGGKPFLCSGCGSAFTRRCEAAKHCANMREKESYKCFLCHENYPSCSDLKEHIHYSHEGSNHCIVRPDSRCSSCDGDTEGSESPDSSKEENI